MKHKKFLLIALICLIGIGISFLLFSAHRPFKDLEAADITSASVRLSPPDTTIQIVETEELVSYLNEVVIYNKDNSYTEYAGQAVIFTLSLADGSQVEIIAYNPFIIIDGIRLSVGAYCGRGYPHKENGCRPHSRRPCSADV